jgi:hypothetical protein
LRTSAKPSAIATIAQPSTALLANLIAWLTQGLLPARKVRRPHHVQQRLHTTDRGLCTSGNYAELSRGSEIGTAEDRCGNEVLTSRLMSRIERSNGCDAVSAHDEVDRLS